MSQAAALAAAAAACGVAAAWEAAPLIDALRGRAFGLWTTGEPGSTADGRRLAATGVVAAGVAGALLSGPVAAVLLAGAAPAAVKAAARERRRRTRRALAAGVPHAARSLADAFGAGHAITGALGQAAGGTQGPAGKRLAAAAEAVALGAPVEAALEAMRSDAGEPAWDSLVSAVLLQRAIGGDLPALLRTLAAGAEKSARAEAGARATLAQATATARLIGTLPLGAAILTELVAPGTFAAIASRPAALALLTVSAALGLLAGALLTALARKAGR